MPASPPVLEYVRQRIEHYKTECLLPETQLLIGLVVYKAGHLGVVLDEIIEPAEAAIMLGEAARKLGIMAAVKTRAPELMLVWLSICLTAGRLISQPPFMSSGDRAGLMASCYGEDDLAAQLGCAINDLLRPEHLRT